MALGLCSTLQGLSWMALRRVPPPLRGRLMPLCSESPSAVPDVVGKDIYQRVFYRLSPSSQVDAYDNIVVEERVRFAADKTKGEDYLKPVGPRTIILRDGKVEEGDIGDEILAINVKETMAENATHRGAGRGSALEATIATILYLSANPKYVEGNVLEFGCGMGLATLLGCIGAGALKADGAVFQNETPGSSEDILTIPKGPPVASELKQLTLSDTERDKLNLAVANVQMSNIPMNKVVVEDLAWRTRSLTPRTSRLFHTIVASDLDYTFPEAKELASSVAHRLESISSWESMKRSSRSPPTFIHVCPHARENFTYLHRFLARGYKMSVNTNLVMLEKLLFNYQMLPEGESEEKLDELEVEVLEFQESCYQSLTAEHNPAYVDGAGEYFFPLETGEYDSSSSQTYLEPENDGLMWY